MTSERLPSRSKTIEFDPHTFLAQPETRPLPHDRPILKEWNLSTLEVKLINSLCKEIDPKGVFSNQKVEYRGKKRRIDSLRPPRRLQHLLIEKGKNLFSSEKELALVTKLDPDGAIGPNTWALYDLVSSYSQTETVIKAFPKPKKAKGISPPQIIESSLAPKDPSLRVVSPEEYRKRRNQRKNHPELPEWMYSQTSSGSKPIELNKKGLPVEIFGSSKSKAHHSPSMTQKELNEWMQAPKPHPAPPPKKRKRRTAAQLEIPPDLHEEMTHLEKQGTIPTPPNMTEIERKKLERRDLQYKYANICAIMEEKDPFGCMRAVYSPEEMTDKEINQFLTWKKKQSDRHRMLSDQKWNYPVIQQRVSNNLNAILQQDPQARYISQSVILGNRLGQKADLYYGITAGSKSRPQQKADFNAQFFIHFEAGNNFFEKIWEALPSWMKPEKSK